MLGVLLSKTYSYNFLLFFFFSSKYLTYILFLFYSSPVCTVYHWKRARGSLFITQQATSSSSLCPGLVLGVLSQQTNTCPKACMWIYYLYMTVFLRHCCSLLPAHWLADIIQKKSGCFPTLSLPVGFYLCNQGFQRQEASLEGSIMQRRSVCPAA